MTTSLDERDEWLEADGLGGFASGTGTGLRTRRYHALLLSAATPPTCRQVLVAGMDVEIAIDGHTYALSSQRVHASLTRRTGGPCVQAGRMCESDTRYGDARSSLDQLILGFRRTRVCETRSR